jgi:hypothetical protein
MIRWPSVQRLCPLLLRHSSACRGRDHTEKVSLPPKEPCSARKNLIKVDQVLFPKTSAHLTSDEKEEKEERKKKKSINDLDQRETRVRARQELKVKLTRRVKKAWPRPTSARLFRVNLNS